MKYKILVLALICSLPLSAQMKQSTFVMGPKVGVQTAKLSFVSENPQNTDEKLAVYYQGGIFTRFNVGKFSLQPEFIYTQKGGNFDNPEQKHTFRYLEAPVLWAFHQPKVSILK